MYTRLLSKLDEMTYWRELNKFPRISGAYSKPEECPAPGCGFSSANRESRCWKHAATKKKRQRTRKFYIEDIQPAPPFTMVWK